MLQSVGSQRVGHDLAIEQQSLLEKSFLLINRVTSLLFKTSQSLLLHSSKAGWSLQRPTRPLAICPHHSPSPSPHCSSHVGLLIAFNTPGLVLPQVLCMCCALYQIHFSPFLYMSLHISCHSILGFNVTSSEKWSCGSFAQSCHQSLLWSALIIQHGLPESRDLT